MEEKNNRTKLGLGGLIFLLTFGLNSCAGSCSNSWNDLKRNADKRDYNITLYGCDGQIIEKRELKNTFISVSENGSGLRYVENGKLRMINGTYILEEK